MKQVSFKYNFLFFFKYKFVIFEEKFQTPQRANI